MNKTVLVLGGAGYVGAHCSKAFAQAGWNVVVYDSLALGWRDFVRWGPLIEGDILDTEALRAAMRAVKPDVVAHFAALISVGESVSRPDLYYRTNTMGALSVLDAMRAAEVECLLFSSTAAVYGMPIRTPIDEDHPLAPINPYGWSKLMVEKMLAHHSSAFGQRYMALRYFNAAGADPDGEIGEKHEPETHLIPLAIRGARDPDYAFTINGQDFDTRDGTCVRDYIHVADLGKAHRRALDHLAKGGASATLNLGTGHGATVAEIVAAVETQAGRAIPRRFGPRREGDPAVLVASNARAQEVLGWTPQRSDIATIIADAWRWHEKNG